MTGSKGVFLWSREGGDPRTIVEPEGPLMRAHFSPDSRTLVTWTFGVNLARVWSVPDGRLLRTHQGRAEDWLLPRAGQLFFATPGGDTPGDGRKIWELTRWPLSGGAVQPLGRVDGEPLNEWTIDHDGKTVLEISGDASAPARWTNPRVSGRRFVEICRPTRVRRRAGRAVHSSAVSGDLRVWSVVDQGPPRILRGAESSPQLENEAGSDLRLAVDPTGRFASAPGLNARLLWDLEGPPDAQPARLRHETRAIDLALLSDFVPGGAWLPVARRMQGDLWPVRMRRPHVLRLPAGLAGGAAMDPHGRFILSTASDERTGGEVRLWPLAPEWGTESRVLYRDPRVMGGDFVIEPQGRFAVGPLKYDGKLVVLPLDGGPPRYLEGFGWTYWVVVDAEGKRVATNFTDPVAKRAILRVWDLESGESWDLDPVIKSESCLDGDFHMNYVGVAGFLPDGRLVSDGMSGLRVWDVEKGTSRQIRSYGKNECDFRFDAITPDGREVVGVRWDAGNPTGPVLATTLESGEQRRIDTHGDRVWALAVDPAGGKLVSGDRDGLVRVGPLTGEEPHLLYGHTQAILSAPKSPGTGGGWSPRPRTGSSVSGPCRRALRSTRCPTRSCSRSCGPSPTCVSSPTPVLPPATK